MMEHKSAPFGGARQGQDRTRTKTLEITLGNEVWRFHRDERGRVWLRVFMWRDQPPGWWAATDPRQLSKSERDYLIGLLDDPKPANG